MKNYFILLLAAQSLGAMDDHQFIRQAQRGNIAYLEAALAHCPALIDQTDHASGFTALHAALWNCDPNTAAFLIENGADKCRRTRGGKTARHFLAQHLGACYRNGMLICKDKPCAVAWPKEFLVRMNGECFICLDKIEEIGHVYDCGHVVHKACVHSSGECTICVRLYRDESSEPAGAAPASEHAAALEPESIVPTIAPVTEFTATPEPAPVAPAPIHDVRLIAGWEWLTISENLKLMLSTWDAEREKVAPSQKKIRKWWEHARVKAPAPAPAPVAPAPGPDIRQIIRTSIIY